METKKSEPKDVNTIIVQSLENPFNLQPFTTFKGACNSMGWSYNYLKRKTPPFDHKGFRVSKNIIKKG